VGKLKRHVPISVPRKDFQDYYRCFGKENNYKDELDPTSDRNFLLLCGTRSSSHKASDGTLYRFCHSLFHPFGMIILYDPFLQSYRYWCWKEAHPLENKSSPTGDPVNTHEDHQPYRRLLVWRAHQALQQRSILYSGMKLGELQIYGHVSLETISMSGDKSAETFHIISMYFKVI
jgi:hypothetical protein